MLTTGIQTDCLLRYLRIIHQTAEVFTNNTPEKAELGTSGITASYAGGGGTCVVYCHGADMPKGSPQTQVPDWTTSLLDGVKTLAGDCNNCHNAPPTTVSPHTGGETLADCAGCHPHFNSDGTLNTPADHIDGTVQASVDCVDCHGTSGPGIDVQTEFGTAITDVNSHHVSKAWGAMTGEDCVACHGEGDPNGDGTASQSGLHPAGAADGTVEMIDNSDSSRATTISITLRGGSGLEDKNNAESTDTPSAWVVTVMAEPQQ
jgi:predicted CxxxxCH...CXXCH cytochrome family protein